MKTTQPPVPLTLLATLSALTLTLALAGCKESSDGLPKSTSAQLAQAGQDTKEAAEEVKEYAYAQKAEFVTKMQAQLAVINRDLDQLSVKIEKANDAAKAEAKPKLEALREQIALLKKQLDEAGNATESTWDSVKAGSRKAYDGLKTGFQQARQWASEKIAP